MIYVGKSNDNRLPTRTAPIVVQERNFASRAETRDKSSGAMISPYLTNVSEYIGQHSSGRASAGTAKAGWGRRVEIREQLIQKEGSPVPQLSSPILARLAKALLVDQCQCSRQANGNSPWPMGKPTIS